MKPRPRIKRIKPRLLRLRRGTATPRGAIRMMCDVADRLRAQDEKL